MERNAAEYGTINSMEQCRFPHIELSGILEPVDPTWVTVAVRVRVSPNPAAESSAQCVHCVLF